MSVEAIQTDRCRSPFQNEQPVRTSSNANYIERPMTTYPSLNHPTCPEEMSYVGSQFRNDTEGRFSPHSKTT